MLDRSAFWSPNETVLQGDGIAARLLPPVPQTLVSGDLSAYLGSIGQASALGLLAEVTGDPYALRIARGRLLSVGASPTHEEAGWRDGIARTPMTGALAVVEVSGARAMELVARGSAVDPRVESPSAAVLFAGVTCLLYRREGCLRLHLDRGLADYMMDWIGQTDLFRRSTSM